MIEPLTYTVDQMKDNLERVTKEKIKAQKQSSYHKVKLKLQCNSASTDNQELTALSITINYYLITI